MWKFLNINLFIFLQLIHLIAMDSTLALSSIKHNSKIANTFNNGVISPCFGSRIFAVCSITLRKGNHWIVSFIVVGQYKSLKWQSIYFSSEVLDMLESIFLSYVAASRLSFHSWRNYGWLVSFNRNKTFALKMLIIIFFLSLNYLWILEEWKLLFATKFFSVFVVEVIVLIQVMNLSEFSISSA